LNISEEQIPERTPDDPSKKTGFYKISCLFFLLFSVVFSGCEGYKTTKGVILDNETKKPLSGVAFSLTKLTNNGQVEPNDFSDSLGHFEFDHFVGSVEGFDKITLHFSKSGYSPVTLTFKNGSEKDTVFLQKTKR
jgi:hypothetical protein